MSLAAPPRPAAARRRARRVVWVGVLLLFVLAVAVPLAGFGYVWWTANHDDRTPTDAILVLGAAQFDGRPSPVLGARLDHARTLFDEGVAPRVITVGGKQPGDRFTEAAAGRRYLVDSGVPSSRVITVGEGDDTLSSMQAVARVMSARGWTSATIVTDPAHEARSLAAARRLGIDARGSATSRGDGSVLTVDYAARETAGLLWFWLVQRWSVAPVVTP